VDNLDIDFSQYTYIGFHRNEERDQSRVAMLNARHQPNNSLQGITDQFISNQFSRDVMNSLCRFAFMAQSPCVFPVAQFRPPLETASTSRSRTHAYDFILTSRDCEFPGCVMIVGAKTVSLLKREQGGGHERGVGRAGWEKGAKLIGRNGPRDGRGRPG